MSNENVSLKITDAELKNTSIEGLSLRPNSSNLTGGAPLSGTELRERIGALPKLLVERFNALLSALGMDYEVSFADAVKITSGGLEQSLQKWIDTLLEANLQIDVIDRLIDGIQKWINETEALLGEEDFDGTVKGRINEAIEAAEYALAIAQNKNRARVFEFWADIVSELKKYKTRDEAEAVFNVGDSFFTTDPSADAWVAGFAYDYKVPASPGYGEDPFGDADTVQIGHVILGKADVKTDLAGYVKSTDVATPDKAGLVKVGSGLSVANDGTVSVVGTGSSDCANALYGAKSGEQTLLLRDVSPLVHSVKLKAVSKNGATVTGSTTVTVQGKNLLPYPYASAFGERYGCTITDGGNGAVVINGQPATTFDFTLSNNLPVFPNVKYTFSINANKADGYLGILQIRTIGGSWVRNLGDDNGNGLTFTVTEDDLANGNRVWANLYVQSTRNYDNVVFKPMLELGGKATDYEPYILPTQTDVPFGREVLLPVLFPAMTVSADRPDAVLTVSYQRDLNQAFRSVASKTEALLMAAGERGFGFTKLRSAIGAHTAEDSNGNSVAITLADSEDGFSLDVDVQTPGMQGGNLSLRIPIATFETEAGKSYTIPALPDKTYHTNADYCSTYYDVSGTAMRGNLIISGLDSQGEECGYQGAQEYLSSGGTKMLYLNFKTTTPYKADELMQTIRSRTLTLPLPDMGYTVTVTKETTYAPTAAGGAQNTLTLTPIDNGVHVSCTHNVVTSGDGFSFDVPIASFDVTKGLYYSVPALAENTADSNGLGAHFEVSLGGARQAMKANYHPTDDDAGEGSYDFLIGNFGVDNFQATASGTATLYLVLEYLGGETDNLTRDFDIVFPMIATSGNITLSPESGTEYRLDVATAATLQLAFPKGIGSDSIYKSVIRFDTAVAIPSVSYPNTFVFAGDGVTSGVFAPVTKKRYCVTLDYDGEKILGKVAEYPV